MGLIGRQTSADVFAGAIEGISDGGYSFLGYNSSSNQVFSVDNSGNEQIAGTLYTAGSCSVGCIAGRGAQRRVVSYAPRESQPTMEDFGEAQLQNGQAYVRLDAAFANVIDTRARYLVILTPEGESNTPATRRRGFR